MEKLQSKKPLIRFPEFKEAWEHKRLNELLSEAKKRNEDLKYGKDEVLSVSGELGIVNQIEHLGRSYAGVSVHQYHVVEVGDIVYTKSPLKANPFGIIKLNKGKAGIVSTLYAVYKVNQKTAYGPFIDYYFSLDANTNRYLRPLVKKGAKNDMKINNAYVLNDRIFAPTIPEQKRIASFFKTLDDKITLLNKKKTVLQNYKSTVVQKLFSKEIRFKNDEGNDYPEWIDTTINKIANVYAGATPSTTKNEFWGGEIRWMNSGELNLKRVYEVENRITELGLKSSSTKLLPKFCVLIGLAGQGKTRGTVAMNLVELCTNQSIAAIPPNEKVFDSEFLFHNLDNRYNELRSLSKGDGGRGGLNLQIIKAMVIKLPCLEEQKKISSFLQQIDLKIKYVETQIEQTKQYKKGLLQNMFI
jgi:type I restriction enzyme, S subunit